MRVFFIIFIFIAVFSVYPKVIYIYSLFNTPVKNPTKGFLPVVTDDKYIYKTGDTNKNNYSQIAVPAEPFEQYEQIDLTPIGVNKSYSPNISNKVERSYKINSSLDDVSLPSTNSKKQILKYKDGEYQGAVINAYYGYVQVKAIMNEGKISDIKFLKFPSNNRNSRYLSNQALPRLKQEVIQKQMGDVDVVSGATYTSIAFMQSTREALLKALN